MIAPKIAKNIGVLNTMILSQMIANGIIIVAALSSNWILATVLYLIKESTRCLKKNKRVLIKKIII